MNPIFIIAMVAVVFVFIIALRGVRQAGAFKNIRPKDVPDLAEKTEKLIILDVRTPGEVNQGKINGAVNVDVSKPGFASEIAKLDKSATYLVYCRSGMRSMRACSIMSNKGFENLYNLTGGYNAWSRG